MSITNTINIKIRLLADELRNGLSNARRELDRLRGAGAGNGGSNAGAGAGNASAELSAASVQADKATSSINRAKAALLGFASTVVSFVFIKGLITTADKWLQLTNTIRQSVDTTEDYQTALTSVLEISRKTYTSLDANAVLFAKINRALKDLGGTTQQSIFLTDMVAKLAGMETNAAGAAAGVYQLTQAIASGKFAGDEFRSVSEQLPIFAATLAKGLGKSLGQLREMSRNGELGTEEIMQGLAAQAKEVDQIFLNMPVTFSKAAQNMENKWLELVGRLNETNGITQTLGAGINLVADNLQTFGGYILKFLAIGFIVGLAKMVTGLTSAAQAMRLASVEARLNAVANAEAQASEKARVAALYAESVALETNIKAEIASARATIASSAAEIRSLQSSIALTESIASRTVLTGMLTRAQEVNAVATAQLTEQQAALTAIQTRNNLTWAKLASMTNVLSGAVAGLVGFELGSWARESSVWVEKLGVLFGGVIAFVMDFRRVLNDPLQFGKDIADQFKAVGDESIKSAKEREESEKHTAEVAKQAEEMKFAALQEGIKKSKDKLERLNDARKTIYDRDMANLKQAEQAKLNALDNAIPAKLAVEERYQGAKLTTVQAAELSELALLEQKTATEIEFNNRRLEASRQFNQQKLNDVNAIYSAEIESAKQRNLDITGLEREANNEKKAILLELEKSYSASIDKLTQLDQQHRNKAVGYLNDINAQEQNLLNQLRALDAQGLSNAQSNELRKRQIAEDTAQVKKLIADGEYTKAVELSKKLQDLTLAQAQATKQAAIEANKVQAGTGDDAAALAARRQHIDTVNLTTQALQASANAEAKNHEIVISDANKKITALEQVRSELSGIDLAINKANMLKISTDTTQVDSAITKIDSIPTEKTVNIKTNLSGLAPAGFSPNFGAGGAAPAKETINLNLSFGGQSALVTGEINEVKNLVKALTDEVNRQKRSSR